MSDPSEANQFPIIDDQQARVDKAAKDAEEAKNKFLQSAMAAHDKGELFSLSSEEVNMLVAFRLFKKKIKKPTVFTWQTVQHGD